MNFLVLLSVLERLGCGYVQAKYRVRIPEGPLAQPPRSVKTGWSR